jgi:nucleoside-diphosphate-sugar epimerase
LKALVTGGTGFIGSHLTEALIRKGVQVRCLLRKTSDSKWLKSLPMEFVHGDFNDRTSLENAVRGVDWVLHLAGVTKAIKEETYFEANGLGTENLIHACLENNPRLQKFIYISSQAAAGPSRNGRNKKELDPCEPVSIYGRSKREGEEIVLTHAQEASHSHPSAFCCLWAKG